MDGARTEPGLQARSETDFYISGWRRCRAVQPRGTSLSELTLAARRELLYCH